ncbi:uncharacterized protein BDFB_003803 [Asbolus verrucosus]|uniref:SET and MYND domain-containing protein 4 n=1 Tax=Asbolus verrucosus TaxID=1661398 RepID=A0A482W1T8_ASBVE|nr:uncharacterized protein BDFB_003803 [Asbolus verrucosus]
MATNTVFQALDTETNRLAQYFLNRIYEDNSAERKHFLSWLKHDVKELHDKVNIVHKKLLMNQMFPNFAIDTKNDIIAADYRNKGNDQFQLGNSLEAVEHYNNCIAMAKSKEILALAYADRSEVFFTLCMRKECLEEIERALASGYPDEVQMAGRRERIQQLQESANNYYEEVPEIIAKHPTIQSASDCVRIGESGRCVVATRDIDIGEVIAVEKPYTSAVFPNDNLFYCHHCSKLCYNMIACEHCTQALFCGKECKQKSLDLYHRYECPILFALNEYKANDTTLLVALRVALLALNDCFMLNTFEGDHRKVYRSDRYNEIHFLRPTSEPSELDLLHETVLTAFVYELLWAKTSYFHRVTSLWCHQDDFRNKFKEVMLQQLLSTKFNAVKIYDYVHNPKLNETDNYGFGMYSFFPLFAHSCCANVMKSYHGTTMVLRALNTIKKGHQCFVNRYGLRYDAFTEPVRSHMLLVSRLPPCECKACRERWIPHLGNLPQICEQLGIENMEFEHIIKRFIGIDLDVAKEYLPRLIAMLKECEEAEPLGNALILKRMIAHCYAIFGNKRML